MLRLLALIAVIAAAQAPPPGRAIVVIGDLHMGPGRDASGNWHAVEDFRWRDEFLRFLDAINTQGAANSISAALNVSKTGINIIDGSTGSGTLTVLEPALR